MRALVRSACLLSLLIASSASAVAMEWRFVGNAGNYPDAEVMNDETTGYGSVPYAYYIGTYEVTNAQYAEFLNAKAVSDPFALYNTNMGSGYGGITRSGSSGNFTYSTIAGRGNMPVNFVSFYDALRFANWLNNGQGSGDTETGAYTLLGGTSEPSNGTTVTRNAGATIFLPSEDEWYKAAYYDAARASYFYFDYPAGSDMQMTCTPPAAAANRANCSNVVSDLTTRGSYMGSASPYGTFDQGGNVFEWNEAIIGSSLRGLRGGHFSSGPGGLAASYRSGTDPWFESSYVVGLRVAMLPEPGRDLLLMTGIIGVLGLAGWRRARA